MRLNKKEEKKNKKIVTQQTVDAVHTHTHTHTHTGSNLNKRKRRIVCVISLSLIVMILGIIVYSENIKPIGIIENVKRALGEITQKSNTVEQSDVTTVDVTGITLGKETQHEHVYKTMYDDNEHWEECSICGTKRNQVVHSFKTTWAMNVAQCFRDNYYTDTCTCGYSKVGHKPCVWDGVSFLGGNGQYGHYRKCKICEDYIYYSYYLNSYGSGKLYEVGNNYGLLQCEKDNGTKLNCSNTGTCVKCGISRITHEFTGANNKIYCQMCNKSFGTYSHDIRKNQNNYGDPATYVVTTEVHLTNGLEWGGYGHMRDVGNRWEINTQTSPDSSNFDFSLINTGKFNLSSSDGYYNYIYFFVKFNNVRDIMLALNFDEKDTIFYPDLKSPLISSISIENNLWSKNKLIKITGTENWTNTVKVEIFDDRKNCIYSGKANVDHSSWSQSNPNSQYSISCVPELEAPEEGRTFKVIVTDGCENSVEKEFTISKIDSIAPKIMSSDKVSDGWAREKDFTFTASDHGIGNVQIGFNDVNDYKLANKNGTEYSREYKLTGDVYSPREANVYYKDELGNVSTKKVIIDKLDNTKPTITGASFSNNKLNITAHDRHQTEGEGSGVSKYRFITSAIKLESPEVTVENSTEVLVSENMIIPDIYKVKYVYIVAEDAVGNISEVYEVEVPQLELISKVNVSGANGKGVIELDWSDYDIADKYFVIYRKEENSSEWEIIVPIEQKLTGGRYTDTLANDKTNPSIPTINIEGKQENNNIEITQTATDTGTKYSYYIEAYDMENTLIASSK